MHACMALRTKVRDLRSCTNCSAILTAGTLQGSTRQGNTCVLSTCIGAQLAVESEQHLTGKEHLSKSRMKAYLSCAEGYRVPQALKWQVVTCTCAFRASRRSTYSCSAEELSPCMTVCEFETVHGLRLSHASSARRHLSCASLGQQGGQHFVDAAHIAAWANSVILPSSLAPENPSRKPMHPCHPVLPATLRMPSQRVATSSKLQFIVN